MLSAAAGERVAVEVQPWRLADQHRLRSIKFAVDEEESTYSEVLEEQHKDYIRLERQQRKRQKHKQSIRRDTYATSQWIEKLTAMSEAEDTDADARDDA